MLEPRNISSLRGAFWQMTTLAY